MLFESDYEATFTAIDADGDGLITAAELKALMASLGQELSDEAATTMLQFVDGDQDGKVTQAELRAYLSAN